MYTEEGKAGDYLSRHGKGGRGDLPTSDRAEPVTKCCCGKGQLPEGGKGQALGGGGGVGGGGVGALFENRQRALSEQQMSEMT